MISEWNLARFKAVDRAQSLKFGDITLFVGANSSGKSTWLQSMLLVAQTLASQLDSYSVVLNGSLAKLGQFDDIVSNSEGSPSINIGCRLWQGSDSGDPSEDLDVHCRFAFDANPTSLNRNLWQVRPRLLNVDLTRTSPEFYVDESGEASFVEETKYIKIRRRAAPDDEVQRIGTSDGVAPLDAPVSSAFDVTLDPASEVELGEELLGAQPTGCIFNHFLPRAITVRFDKQSEGVRFLIRQIGEVSRFFRVPRHLSEAELQVPEAAFRIIFDGVEGPQLKLFEDAGAEPRQNMTVRDLQTAFRLLTPPMRLRVRSNVSEKREQLRSLLLDHIEAAEGQAELTLGESLDEASRFLVSWFRDSFRYLGPLRDDPRAQYPLSSGADPKDVGLRGEHTAAVLHVFRDVLVPYIHPSETNGPSAESVITRVPLHYAVDEWVKYLELADQIETDDQGKQGHGMRVRRRGELRAQDLTHVGVGVSQVLPILVMALLSETGTCLVFEQPEIHLHPRVQSRLGDFFLSMAFLGKQCVIETHSEYILNRLRLRSVLDSNDNTSKRIRVYFAERNGSESTYRPVTITPYGAVLDWPKGFFDETPGQVEQIIFAAMQKRRREVGSADVHN